MHLKGFILATFVSLSAATGAHAAVVATPGSTPAGTTNFNSQSVGAVTSSFTIGGWTFTPGANSQVKIGSDGNGAQPFGTSGNYLSILGNGYIDISFSSRTSIGFFWGSVDSYNSISFSNGDTFSGSQLSPTLSPTGCQGSPDCNSYVTLTSTTPFTSVRLSSSANSFEITNISAVPEPSTWAMMILGFLGLGFLGYRKSQSMTAFRIT